MKFFKDVIFHVRWLLAVVRAFMRVRPVTTISVVILSVVSRITGLMATFLPLKVVILAASPGVPRYLRGLVTAIELDRTQWIIIFSAAAVLAYFVTMLIDALSSRLSEKASMDVLSGANEMAVASKMRAEAQTYYSRFTNVCTSWMFGMLGLAALPLVNMAVFLVVTGLILAELLFTALVLEYTDPHRPRRLRRMITHGLGSYLETLSTITFLTGFLAILASHLSGAAGDIMIAILSIVLMRRCFGSLASGIKGLTSLAKRRAVINPLVFRQQTTRPKETATNRSLRALFRKADRERRSAAEIRHALGKAYDVSVRWEDSRLGAINTFMIEAVDRDDGSKQHFQQQVFPAKSLHLLENEEFLFSVVPRDSLDAPEVIARFREGPFECQIYRYGLGIEPPSDAWSRMLVPMIIDQWGFKPPARLVSAFNTAKSLLSARLQRGFISRISVAIDTPEERELYKTLMDALPQIASALNTVPLYIHNPDFGRASIAYAGDDKGFVMAWGRWSLAPIGVKPLDRFNDEELAAMMREVAKCRDDVPEGLTPAHLRLVATCYELERTINKEEYKAALHVAAKVLKSPVFQESPVAPEPS